MCLFQLNKSKLLFESPYEHCFFRCITASALEWCHCIGLNTFIEQNSSSICTAREAYDCQKKYSGMQPGPEVLLFGKCDDQCRIPCETYQYAIIASSMLANHPEAPNILENKNFGTVGDRIAMWIYYPELYINVITEKYQFTWQTLLSNIGGIYGLWIGAIVTGVIHIFYSLFTSLWEILCERQGRQGDIV